MYVMPKEAAKYMHVCEQTLRRWADDGKIKVIKTKAGHRRYWIDEEKSTLQKKNKKKISIKKKNSKPHCNVIAYARVSSKKQYIYACRKKNPMTDKTHCMYLSDMYDRCIGSYPCL